MLPRGRIDSAQAAADGPFLGGRGGRIKRFSDPDCSRVHTEKTGEDTGSADRSVIGLSRKLVPRGRIDSAQAAADSWFSPVEAAAYQLMGLYRSEDAPVVRARQLPVFAFGSSSWDTCV